MTAEKIIAMAKSQLGVKEYPANTNRVKYTSEYGIVTAWCVIFVWWVFKHCNASKIFYDGGKVCSCTTLMNWAKKKGLWVTTGYKPGDLLIYDWNKDGKPEHIGICTKVSGSSVEAIEGNTSINNNSNGGQVMTRARHTSQILGAVRPKYANANNAKSGGDKCMIELSVLSVGSKGEQVKAVQRLLKSMGYRGANNTALSIDGDFGNNTKIALVAFQKAKGLTADGVCGSKTWSKLIKGV